jgi:hypothetical protein
MPTILRFFRPALKARAVKNLRRTEIAGTARVRSGPTRRLHPRELCSRKKPTAGYKARYLAVTTLFPLRGT